MKYVFNETEFVSLLLLEGVKKLYSFELDNNPDNVKIIEAVHSLCKAGLVSEENGRMVACKELKEIVSAMSDAKYALRLFTEDSSVPARLVYFADNGKVVVIYRHVSDKENAVKAELADIEDFIEDIISNEISEYIADGMADDHELAEKISETELCDETSSKTVFRLETINTRTEKTEQCVHVNRTPLFARIVSEKGQDVSSELYTEEKMKQYLFEALIRRAV